MRRLFATFTMMLALAAAAHAGGEFTLDWMTIDGGGGTSVGGNFELSGTIGQPDAGGPMTGGNFTLVGGFWPGIQTAGPGLLGDMNCDGNVSVGDINPFVLALTDPTGYAAMFPDCNILNGDCTEDGNVSVGDINCFVALVTGG